MEEFFTVSEVARRLGAAPKDISDAFYLRRLDDRVAPVQGGRRMIPASYLEVVASVLRERGHLPRAEVARA